MIQRLLTPREVAASVADLDPEALHRRGVRGVILDLDNTIVPWGRRTVPPVVHEWVEGLRRTGIRVCIVSNNSGGWARQVSASLGGIPVVGWALKPVPFGFRRAMRLMGTAPAQTALVGDQLFTDVLGGNLLGVYTILVEPLSPRDWLSTRLVRLLEGPFRRRLARRFPQDTG
ncbi:MAG: YqeG family HAD IIIA-type phosphatase [Armatimonadota bacterium]|nr:YqeG family HAD IIIA-type phosphatase [Armatimonadota bacterium]MDR7450432.1 YqeG family HAD IIIA-type phosphatase [Armatimonadota bacterium]MDR7466985.1 YqeG family HAD IIIA-type phosphatase [Armatimonadota bacterium]MDR7493473.1 YqeG family HAD IIIA-type phosphatase [Armatimonadota bacterium]MDR7498738.1 YqeG family HAD IIIA-type phosphatase [Armatimonadota bacterium]